MTEFNWASFKGSALALKLNKRDLPCLDSVVARVPGRTCAVQAGGSLGVWPKRLAQSFQTVYTFEPAADLFVTMTANAPEKNILRYQAALGYDRGLVGVSRVRRDGKDNNHEGITHVVPAGNIPTLRLDDFALPVVDLLCLDLEGWEPYALCGAEETILRCRPVLMVEINKNLGFLGMNPETVRLYITHKLGYSFIERMHSDDVWLPQERAA